MTLYWSTTGWSSPPKTGTTTTRRTTAPPSTTVPGGTATATPPTLTASTCAASTRPTQTASSGPPGRAGSTHSSSPRLRYGPPATLKRNDTERREKKKINFWNITNQTATGRIICLDIVSTLKHTSLSLVDVFFFAPDVSHPSCPSSSITQKSCWLPQPFPLLPFFKKENNVFVTLSFSDGSVHKKRETRAPGAAQSTAQALLSLTWWSKPPLQNHTPVISSWHVALTSHLCWHGT